MKNGQPVEFSVDTRMMVDAAFFQKINPNYSRVKVTKPTDWIPVFNLSDYFDSAEDYNQDGNEAPSAV
jgi:hypothetical protein